jgi:hypothetical protein
LLIASKIGQRLCRAREQWLRNFFEEGKIASSGVCSGMRGFCWDGTIDCLKELNLRKFVDLLYSGTSRQIKLFIFCFVQPDQFTVSSLVLI